MAAYVPKQGDIIAITFDPQSGHEQPCLCCQQGLVQSKHRLGYCMPNYKHRSRISLSHTHPKRQEVDGFHYGRASQIGRLPISPR